MSIDIEIVASLVEKIRRMKRSAILKRLFNVPKKKATGVPLTLHEL